MTSSSRLLEARTHHCSRCLAQAAADQALCEGCGTHFEGASHFDLVAGPPPSHEFAFLFPPSEVRVGSV